MGPLGYAPQCTARTYRYPYEDVAKLRLPSETAADHGLDHMTHESAAHGFLSADSGPHDTGVVAARLGDDREVGDPTDAAPPQGIGVEINESAGPMGLGASCLFCMCMPICRHQCASIGFT